MKTNAEADLGSAISTDCNVCCQSPKRKIIQVTTDAATTFARLLINNVPAGLMPLVSASNVWDHHWYRKDSDRSWSHKRGQANAQQDDAAGSSPICNPCNASRSYANALSTLSCDYRNVVGSWCV
jgi:hypothetical protein